MTVHSKPGEKVWFWSGTIKIAGLLWVPEDIREGERLPAIVIARGFGSVKEFVNPGFAPVLNNAGFVVLGFDYPGLGESGGLPGRLIPTEHADAIRAGITFLQAQPSVDPDRIGLLGDSMGGAHVLWAAAHDPRARAVISYGGPGDGDRWFRGLMGYERYLRWKETIATERTRRTLTGENTKVSAYDFLAFGEKERAEWDEFEKEFPTSHPPITIETAEKYLEYKPEAVVANISPRPVFFVTAATSIIVPPDESEHLYAAAREPKRLWIIPPSGASMRYATHLKGHGYSEHVARAFIDFFQEWIPSPRAG